MNTVTRVVQLGQFIDSRGILSVGEGDALPFQPARFFLISEVPAGAVRGQHAHKKCHQLVVVVKGSCHMTLVDRDGRDELLLSGATGAVHIPPLVWGEQRDFSPDAVILVLASEKYDPDDYIRSIDELLVRTR